MKKIFFIALLIIIHILSFAQVQWQDNGIPVRQGENIVWNQASVACEDNTFVSIWTDTRNGIRGVYAQKVDENGNSLWGETGLEIYESNTMQDHPIAISSTDNSVIVCWQDYDAIEIYTSKIRVQKIDASGNLLWGENGIFLEESGVNGWDPKLVKHNDGGVYIIWKETAQSDIIGIRLLADGSIAEGWGEGIEIFPATYIYETHSDQMDGIILASKTDDDIYVQRIDEDGNKLWGYYGTLLHNGNEDIHEIDICSSVANEYYFSWRTYGQNGVYEIAMQKADSTGSSIWNSPTIITEEYATKLFTICSSDSQPILTWTHNYSIYSQKLDSNGNLLWGDEGIILFESDYYLYNNSVVVKEDDANCCIISWAAESNDFENKIHVQRINSNGDLLFGEEGQTIYESSNYYLSPSLVISDQKYYVCWFDYSENNTSLIHQIIDGEGNIFLDENGEVLFTGRSGSVYRFQMLSNEDNPIIVWSERQYDITKRRIFLQILGSDGSNIFEDNGIPITTNSHIDQLFFETVFGVNSETIATVWSESREGYGQIFTQGIDTSGNYLWSDSTGVILTSPDIMSGNPIISSIDNSGTDEYYIGWEDWSNFWTPVIYGQKIIDGEMQWGENGILISGESENCYVLDIIDKFYIWKSIDYPNTGVKVKLIDEDGNTAQGWPDDGFHIADNSNYQNYINFKLIPSGLFILWFENDEDCIYGQIIDYEGNILWQEGGIPLVYGEDINNFNVHYNDALYVVWNEHDDENYHNYYIQKYSENGEDLWQEGGIRISYWTHDSQSDPVIASVEQDVLVAWEHRHIDGTTHIKAQLVSPTGELQYDLVGLTICNEYMAQYSPQVYTNGDNAYICWMDRRSTFKGDEGLGSIPGIYAQKIQLEPTLADNELVKPIDVLYNYPNPFNPETTIYFETTNSHEFAQIEIYNIKGQKVRTIDCHTEPVEVGNGSNNYTVTWNGTDQNNQPVASGIYFYQLNVDDKVIASKKCLLLK